MVEIKSSVKRARGRPVEFIDKRGHRREYMRAWRARRKVMDAARLDAERLVREKEGGNE